MRKMVAGLAVFVSLLFGAAPVHASPPHCYSGWFCVYENATAPFGGIDARSGNLRRNVCTPLAAATGSYVWNRTSTRWYLFRTKTCGGSHIQVPPHMQGSVLAFAPDATWNDAVIAVMRTSATH